MGDITFNINGCVKVKLNNWGKQLYINRVGVAPRVDEDGYTMFQLWWLMAIYGEHMTLTSRNIPFETNILVINKED